MKTLKIVVAIALAVVVAALLTSAAYAYTGGGATNLVPKDTVYRDHYWGMISSGRMMGGYGYHSSAPAGTTPSTSGETSTTPTTPSNQYPIGGRGCFGMGSRLP